jgi:hypothetical protein
MNSGSFNADIVFNPDVSIYSDTAAKSLILSATGGIWAKNQRIDIPPVAVFG